jgi:hypothetical protein
LFHISPSALIQWMFSFVYFPGPLTRELVQVCTDIVNSGACGRVRGRERRCSHGALSPCSSHVAPSPCCSHGALSPCCSHGALSPCSSHGALSPCWGAKASTQYRRAWRLRLDRARRLQHL